MLQGSATRTEEARAEGSRSCHASATVYSGPQCLVKHLGGGERLTGGRNAEVANRAMPKLYEKYARTPRQNYARTICWAPDADTRTCSISGNSLPCCFDEFLSRGGSHSSPCEAVPGQVAAPCWEARGQQHQGQYSRLSRQCYGWAFLGKGWQSRSGAIGSQFLPPSTRT